ncbi:MAG: orotidine-5'-phosphate decarboxylase [Calditrichaeota bacterium]|nr:MAG: orotidine-5'-phosphate decarboxylase [Calditrichota bacterium]
MNFNGRVDEIIGRKNSMLCVGLDPVLEKLPQSVRTAAEPFFMFNKLLIDATIEFACAFKLNLAFYEAYGLEGWRALKKTFEYLPPDVIRIADAKRGDIGNTAQMYARALFDDLGADAVTLNPYMGYDSAEPFLCHEQKGAFFLCLTSNPGSKDFQHFSNREIALYEKVAITVNDWNSRDNCGLVVGATHPEELARVRSLAPALPLLIPGIGAQGGDLEASVKFGTNQQKSMALFNSSRAIIYASANADFALKAAVEAKTARDQLNSARNQ